MRFFKPNIEILTACHDVRGLVKAFAHRDYVVAEGASDSLKKVSGEECVELIIPLLQHRDGKVRLRAARLLSFFKDRRTVEPLVAAIMNEEDEYVKAKLIQEAGELADPRAAEVLQAFLSSDKDRIKLEAAIALGRLGDRRAVDPLIHLLREAVDTPPLASRLIDALGDTADAGATEILVGIVGLSPEESLERPDYSTAFVARDALLKILNKQAGKVRTTILQRLARTNKLIALSEVVVHAQTGRGGDYGCRRNIPKEIDCLSLKDLAERELARRSREKRNKRNPD